MGKPQNGARVKPVVSPPLRSEYGDAPLVVAPSLAHDKQFRALGFEMITVYITEEDDGGYSAVAANLPGCASGGGSVHEALLNFIEALEGCLETYREMKQPVPRSKMAKRPAGAVAFKVLAYG